MTARQAIVSHALYSTRLYLAGTRGGVAKLHGRLVRLAAPPDLGMRYVAVDYIPEMGLRQIMPYGCGWRDMFDAEVAAADAALAALTRQAVDGWAIRNRAGARVAKASAEAPLAGLRLARRT